MQNREIQLLRQSNEALRDQVDELLEFKKKFFELATSTHLSHEDFKVKDGLDYKEERELQALGRTRDELEDKQQVTVVGMNKRTA